jgi:PAS domain S-box-containing protein
LGVGDARYDAPLRTLKEAADPAGALLALADEDVVSALAASAREADPYLANVLATEAHNRLLRLRAITGAMEEGVVVTATDGRVVYVNRATERMFQLDAAAIANPGSWPAMHGGREGFERYQRLLEEQVRLQGTARVETEMQRPDGERLWTEQVVTPLKNVTGEEVGWVLVIRDVTEPRRLQEGLQHANDLLEAVFSAMLPVSILVDADLRVLRVNAAFEDLLALSEDEVVGRPLASVVPLSPENEVALRGALATGRGFESRGEPDPAGQRIWDWMAEPLRDARGDVMGLMVVAMDVTDRPGVHRGYDGD